MPSESLSYFDHPNIVTIMEIHHCCCCCLLQSMGEGEVRVTVIV